MKRSRFTKDQIIGILKENEAGISVAEGCRKRWHRAQPRHPCSRRRSRPAPHVRFSRKGDVCGGLRRV